MKNNKIINAWNTFSVNDEAKKRILNRTNQKIQQNKSRFIFKFNSKRIIITAAIFILLVTTVFASTTYILKMTGSDIKFFNSTEQTKYSEKQELIKKYSGEINITAGDEKYSLTIDNIAFDGTFFSVFYTIKRDVNIYEETENYIEKAKLSENSYNPVVLRQALENYEIDIGIKDFDIQSTYSNAGYDGYFVSDYELRAVKRMTLYKDIPEIIELEIFPNRVINYIPVHEYIKSLDISIPLTIDQSEFKINNLTVYPNIKASVKQYYDFADGTGIPREVVQNITVDKVNISPFGNLLVFTKECYNTEWRQELEANPMNLEIISEGHNREYMERFKNYIITDDKGNNYDIAEDLYTWSQYGENSETFAVEFYGEVPDDIKYLKLTPYNDMTGYFENGVYITDMSVKRELLEGQAIIIPLK